jgi:hypothetical protein
MFCGGASFCLSQARTKSPVTIRPQQQAVPSDVAYALGQQDTRVDTDTKRIDALQTKVDELRRDVDRLTAISDALKGLFLPIVISIITFLILEWVKSRRRTGPTS